MPLWSVIIGAAPMLSIDNRSVSLCWGWFFLLSFFWRWLSRLVYKTDGAGTPLSVPNVRPGVILIRVCLLINPSHPPTGPSAISVGFSTYTATEKWVRGRRRRRPTKRKQTTHTHTHTNGGEVLCVGDAVVGNLLPSEWATVSRCCQPSQQLGKFLVYFRAKEVLWVGKK